MEARAFDRTLLIPSSGKLHWRSNQFYLVWRTSTRHGYELSQIIEKNPNHSIWSLKYLGSIFGKTIYCPLETRKLDTSPEVVGFFGWQKSGHGHCSFISSNFKYFFKSIPFWHFPETFFNVLLKTSHSMSQPHWRGLPGIRTRQKKQRNHWRNEQRSRTYCITQGW